MANKARSGMGAGGENPPDASTTSRALTVVSRLATGTATPAVANIAITPHVNHLLQRLGAEPLARRVEATTAATTGTRSSMSGAQELATATQHPPTTAVRVTTDRAGTAANTSSASPTIAAANQNGAKPSANAIPPGPTMKAPMSSAVAGTSDTERSLRMGTEQSAAVRVVRQKTATMLDD